MKTLSSYLITIFAIMFWFFRLIVAFCATLKIDIGVEPINLTYEIVLLFISLFAIILVIKRNIIGALIYFSVYLFYFGSNFYTLLINLIEGILATEQYLNLFSSGLAVLLGISTLIDVVFNKERTNNKKSKKTDWYYKDDSYDRKLDERADKNNYRTM